MALVTRHCVLNLTCSFTGKLDFQEEGEAFRDQWCPLSGAGVSCTESLDTVSGWCAPLRSLRWEVHWAHFPSCA